MAIKGFIYTILLFFLCLVVVHVIKLAYLGFKSLKKKDAPPPEPKSEPVYYIVEKRRQRKANYSEPKEITFKK